MSVMKINISRPFLDAQELWTALLVGTHSKLYTQSLETSVVWPCSDKVLWSSVPDKEVHFTISLWGNTSVYERKNHILHRSIFHLLSLKCLSKSPISETALWESVSNAQKKVLSQATPQSYLPSCMCLQDYGSADKAVTRLDHLCWIHWMYVVGEQTKLLQMPSK